MTLGPFAVAVGMTPRWVLNALTRLDLPRRRYDEPLARRLSLARMIAESIGVPLPEAYALSGRALVEADPHAQWRKESPNGAVILVIEMPRFFTSYGARLALARNDYGERLRGRRPRKHKSAMRRAKDYGIDTTLLAAQLTRTPEQRVRELDQNIEFLRGVRVGQ